MAVTRIKEWTMGEQLTAADLNAEFDNQNRTGVAFPLTENVSCAGYEVSNAKLTTLKQLTNNVVSIDNYSGFADAISSIGSAITTLMINQNVNVTANATVPSTLTLWFVGQGKLTISSTYTVTINGPVIADPRQIFAGAGTVAFGNGYITELYPQWWGAVGDNSTNNDTALTNAVAAASTAGLPLYWTDGTFLTTASIPLFHSVKHRGPGAVKRGSSTFYVDPIAGQSLAIYVATTGSDTNDGLTSSEPTLTIQQAFDNLELYAPLKGSWTIHVAAGTYAEAVSLPDATTGTEYLIVRGPSVATVQTTPTAIIDYPGSGTVGMDLGSRNKVKVQDIKFTDWKGSAVTGLNIDDHSTLWAYNVHCSYCRQGIVANAARLYVQGGILHGVDWTTGAFPAGGGSVGIVAYAGTVASIGYGGTSAATGTIIENFALSGYEGKANTHVVATWCTFQSNEIAAWVYSNSRFDDRCNIFKKNELVYRVQHGFISRDDTTLGPSDYNLGETYAQAPSDVGDGNYEIYNFQQFSGEESYIHQDAIGGLDICHQRTTSATQTGTITSTLTRNLCTIYGGSLTVNSRGKYIEVYLCGVTAGATGTKTIILSLGGVTVTTLTIAAGSVTWTAHVTIWASNSTSVVYINEATNATITTVRGSAVVDMWSDQTLDVYTAIPGAADTAILHEARVISWG